jgi:hypothetical protein
VAALTGSEREKRKPLGEEATHYLPLNIINNVEACDHNRLRNLEPGPDAILHVNWQRAVI